MGVGVWLGGVEGRGAVVGCCSWCGVVWLDVEKGYCVFVFVYLVGDVDVVVVVVVGVLVKLVTGARLMCFGC